MNRKKFVKTVKNCLKIIRPGLEDDKCLLNDGLMNLSMKELEDIDNGDCLILLTIAIQAYPSNQWEFKGGDEVIFLHVKVLEQFVSFAVLQKSNLAKFKYGKNKIYPDFRVIVDISFP